MKGLCRHPSLTKPSSAFGGTAPRFASPHRKLGRQFLDTGRYILSDDCNLVLSARPGITDRASVEFKDESEILSAAFDPELAYRTVLLPKKLAYYRAYVRGRSFGGDIAIILRPSRRC